MSPLPPKLASSLRLLRHPSQWKWLERFIDRAYFVPIHDCGDFTKFNGPEYWMDPQTGMPRSKMTKTSAFARYFFPEEAKRIDAIRKRNLATKKALATVEKLASEVKAQGEADASEAKAKAESEEGDRGDKAAGETTGVKERETAGKAGGDGIEGSGDEVKGGKAETKAISEGDQSAMEAAMEAASAEETDTSGTAGEEESQKEGGSEAAPAAAGAAKTAT